MGDFQIEATKNGFGFATEDIAYRAMGLDDVKLANEQIHLSYSKDESIVFFTCANLAYRKITSKESLYFSFSLDELDCLIFYCLDFYRKQKERRPYDGSISFENYIEKYILQTARTKYASSKETDNDHLICTKVTASGEKAFYGKNGRMVQFVSIDDQNDSATSTGSFEDMVINRIDAEKAYVNPEIIEKLEKSHPLLKIVLKLWIEDLEEKPVPLSKYATDKRVLELAVQDERCVNYVLEDGDGNYYINASTISRFLYKLQDQLSRDDVMEIVRLGSDVSSNPYLQCMVG